MSAPDYLLPKCVINNRKKTLEVEKRVEMLRKKKLEKLNTQLPPELDIFISRHEIRKCEIE